MNLEMLTSDDYKKLKNISFSLSGGLFCGLELSAFYNHHILFAILLGLDLSSIYMIRQFNKKRMSTPNSIEEVELLKIYREVLKDIEKLTKEFDNKTVIEHHELLEILIACEYLKYRSIPLQTKKVENELYILGALSLNNHGVCRHNATFEKDFLSDLGYKSRILLGAHAKGTPKDFHELLGMSASEKYMGTPSKNIIVDGSIPANHAICMVNDKDYSYYLDLACDTMYTRNDNICTDGGLNVFIVKPELDSDYKLAFDMKKLKTKESLPIGELRYELDKAGRKMIGNIDLLEKFQTEQRDRLERAEEIYQKYLVKK